VTEAPVVRLTILRSSPTVRSYIEYETAFTFSLSYRQVGQSSDIERVHTCRIV